MGAMTEVTTERFRGRAGGVESALADWEGCKGASVDWTGEPMEVRGVETVNVRTTCRTGTGTRDGQYQFAMVPPDDAHPNWRIDWDLENWEESSEPTPG